VTIVRQRELDAKLRDATFAKRFASGSSPGAIGAALGITRQAVYDLVRRGRLDAIRLVSDRTPQKLLAVLITSESVQRYRATRYERQAS
jgi:hypothetical protein